MHRVRRILAPVLFLSAIAAGIYYLSLQSRPPSGPLTAAGTIEAVELPLALEASGRVTEVAVREGDRVAQGQELVKLDDDLLAGQLRAAQASVSAAAATRVQAERALASARLQLEQARLAARAQSRSDRMAAWTLGLPGDFTEPAWYFDSAEELEAARAEVAAAEADLRRSAADLASLVEELGIGRAEERLARALVAVRVAESVLVRARRALDDEGLIADAEVQWEQADAELEAAQEAYDDLLDEDAADRLLDARRTVALARARRDAALDRLDGLRIGEFSLAVEAAKAVVRQADSGLAQAEAAVAAAAAQVDLIELQAERLILVSPLEGVVLTRLVEPGQVVLAGAPALVLADLDRLTITVFVPEDRYGQIRLGDPVRVEVDSFPGEVFSGTVARIADQAEFTPRNVQTEEGRRTTVFAVEISLDDETGRLKPGMPADVEFNTP